MAVVEKEKTERKPRKAKDAPEREVRFPALRADWRLDGNAVTAEEMKGLLGWQEEPEGERWERGSYLLKDVNGRKVRCLNNTSNRPFDRAWALTVAQEHLRRRWRVNGEPLIFGRFGTVLSAQHRGVGLVLAEQLRLSEPALWSRYWKGPVTMECLLVTGVDESDEVVDTIDTGRPRSVADVVFRHELFADLKGPRRKAAAKMTEWAIRLLWERTGANDDPHTPARTHAESMDFLHRHPGILKAVRHVLEENATGQVKHYLTPGYASGLLYLMGVSNSDGEAYRGPKDRPRVRTEKSLDRTLWDKACEFWTLLVNNATALKPVADVMLHTDRSNEKIAAVVKGWNLWSASGKVTPKAVALKLVEREGRQILDEAPQLPGIDLGPAGGRRDDDVDDEDTGEDPTPQEIERAKERIKRENLDATRRSKRNGKNGKPMEPHSKTSSAEQGDGDPRWRAFARGEGVPEVG